MSAKHLVQKSKSHRVTAAISWLYTGVSALWIQVDSGINSPPSHDDELWNRVDAIGTRRPHYDDVNMTLNIPVQVSFCERQRNVLGKSVWRKHGSCVYLDKKTYIAPPLLTRRWRRSSRTNTNLRRYCVLSLIHIWRCRRIERCRSRWSPYH